MDLMTVIGLLAGLSTIYYVMAEGNILHMLFNPVAFVLVFGGTISATLISYPWDILKHTLPSFKIMFFNRRTTDRQSLIEHLTMLAEKARRQSVESLQQDVMAMDDEFMSYGLQMVIDGLEEDVVKDNLEKEILFARQHHQTISSVFRTMATLSPIFGLLGTLIGVVQVLRNLSDPSSMGSSMAIAITTTFYGIFAANFLFLPVAIKLNEHSENDIMRKQLITEGITAIHAGELPMIVKKKLNAFLLSHLHEQGKSKKN